MTKKLEELFNLPEIPEDAVPDTESSFHSIEEMNRERGNQDLTPLQKEKSEKILEEQHRLMKEKMSKKEHESILKTKKYEDKNKSILSSFLQLT